METQAARVFLNPSTIYCPNLAGNQVLSGLPLHSLTSSLPLALLDFWLHLAWTHVTIFP